MIAKSIAAELSGSSMIREMFEKGQRLKALHGADKVYDFSLGNPDLPAPPEIAAALVKLAAKNEHGYMPNAGYPALRERIAGWESEASGRKVLPSGIVVTVGAAGALNIILKSILDPDDEVLILTPYFPEYLTYIVHCGARYRIVDCSRTEFKIDLDAVEAALSPQTKAVILNSPNNPSGCIYQAAELERLNDALKRQGHDIYVIADEPYAEITFDGHATPSPLRYLDNCLRVYSWSKAYSLAGERIGYVALAADCADYERLCNALIFLNRSLGFVNAPAIWQQVLLEVGRLSCPVAAYESRVVDLCNILNEAGLPCTKPEGSFYLFPKTPGDDSRFVAHLADYNILCVPGKTFGAPGYMRLSSCVPQQIIESSRPAWVKALQNWRG